MDKKLFLYAAGVLLMAACSSNDVDTSEPNVLGEIQLYTEVSQLTRAANGAVDNLQDTQFTADTTISVQVTDNAASDPVVVYPLATYKADGNGGLSTETPLYFPPSGSSVNIYAFHPAGAPENFSVKTDQSTTKNYVDSDLMWASLSGITKTSTADERRLQFTHKLSKVIVSLVKGSGVTDDEINAATISLGTVVYKGTFTASTGTFVAADGNEASNTSTITIATNAGTSQHAAIIVPQDVTGKLLTIAMGGGTQSYTFPETTFAAGKKYTYVVTVNKTGLNVTTTITDWATPDGWNTPANVDITF